jgi:tRNA-dihydrouridine synthase B
MGKENYIKPVKIAGMEIENNVFLAPMAGITDMPYRILCKEQGAGLVCSEMISAKGMFFNDEKTNALMEFSEFERPVSVQLFGRDPDIIASVIQKIANKKPDIIDLNFGCPAKKIIKNGEGSALLKEPELLFEIVRKSVNASKIPVSVKIRCGFNEIEDETVYLAQGIENEGACMITVHGRFTKQMYSGKADLGIIKEIKRACRIPVAGNGDINSFDSMKNMIDITGCDAVMTGRAAIGNPWLFSEILNNKKRDVSNEIIFKTIKRHINMLNDFKGEYIAVREMRKHISFYIKGIKNASAIKNIVYRCDKIKDVLEVLGENLIK